MGRIRTAGLVKRGEIWHIDKTIGGKRLCESTGETELEQAELYLAMRIERYRRVYQAIDDLRRRYGKHAVFLGSSFSAHCFAQHVGERGDAPKRKGLLFKGETLRKRLGIPMVLGMVK